MSMTMSDISELYKNSQYSVQMSKLVSSYGALKILAETGKGHGRQKCDTLSISEEARQFSRESVVALFNKETLVTAGELRFYFEHYNDMRGILDAINFSGDVVSAGGGGRFREFGEMEFNWNGIKQVVPIYAVPRINAKSLPRLQAHGNVLKLDNRSYYSVTAGSGRSYAMCVYNGYVGQPSTELLLREDYGGKDKRELIDLEEILTDLAKGRGCSGKVKEVLRRVGIVEGHFTVEAGSGVHHYALHDNGVVENVDSRIEFLNEMNWIKDGYWDYQENDIFYIYGNEYKIRSDGHIFVSVDDGFTDTEIVYPPHRKRP